MAPNKILTAIVVCFLFCGSHGVISNGIEIHGEVNSNHVGRQLDAPTLLKSITSNLISRGFSSSGGNQVISLNLTNLLVLVLLKALIFAAGSLGAGHWKDGFGRNLEEDDFLLNEQEILLYLSYLKGQPGRNRCLKFAACLDPQTSRRYLIAGEVLFKLSNLILPLENDSYIQSLSELREGVNYGLSEGDCNKFNCDRKLSF